MHLYLVYLLSIVTSMANSWKLSIPASSFKLTCYKKFLNLVDCDRSSFAFSSKYTLILSTDIMYSIRMKHLKTKYGYIFQYLFCFVWLYFYIS